MGLVLPSLLVLGLVLLSLPVLGLVLPCLPVLGLVLPSLPVLGLVLPSLPVLGLLRQLALLWAWGPGFGSRRAWGCVLAAPQPRAAPSPAVLPGVQVPLRLVQPQGVGRTPSRSRLRRGWWLQPRPCPGCKPWRGRPLAEPDGRKEPLPAAARQCRALGLPWA
jgi:hypothetical protein